jgi:adenosylhomocysteine nucleosidase
MDQPTPTLVCFAVKEEASFFTPQQTVKVLVTGMGRKNAERSIRAALADWKPALVLSAGFAGGLREDLKTGDLVFSETGATGLRRTLLQAGAKEGRFHFSGRVATTATEKRKLRELTGADAVEMESAAICRVCQEQGIPSATVRVILDPANENLPLDFNRVLNKNEAIDARKLALEIVKSPSKIRLLLRLRRQSEVAAKELARVLNLALQREQS